MEFELTLLVNRACNLACDYCYDRVRTAPVMSRETARQAIEWALSRAGPGGSLVLHFFGGEPLLSFRDLVPMLEDARHLSSKHGIGVSPALMTNGVLLDREVWTWVRENHIALTVSLDGGPQTHDVHRRFADGRGSFSQIRAALDLATDDRGEITLATVLSPDTVERIPEGISSLIGQGFRRFTFSPDFLATWDEQARERAERGIGMLGRLCCDSLSRDIPVSFSFIEEKVGRLLPATPQMTSICSFGRTEAAVLPDGNVFPCERIIGAGDRFRLGHLAELLSGDPGDVSSSLERRFQEWERRSPGLSSCHACGEKRACTRFCRCLNYMRTGDIFRPDSLICFFERLFIRTSCTVAAEFLTPPTGAIK